MDDAVERIEGPASAREGEAIDYDVEPEPTEMVTSRREGKEAHDDEVAEPTEGPASARESEAEVVEYEPTGRPSCREGEAAVDDNLGESIEE